MSDDCIPDLIDVSVNSCKNKTEDKNETLIKDTDEFKLIVSKRKRREQNKMEASTSADADEMEDECEDIEDEEAELEMQDKTQNEQIQIKKLKFPPISAEKLMVF